MAIPDPFPLTRSQIQTFTGNNHETIRRIERLFEVAGKETPGSIEGIEIAVGNAVAIANSLIAIIEAFANDTGTNLAALDAKIGSFMELDKKIENLEFMMHAINVGY